MEMDRDAWAAATRPGMAVAFAAGRTPDRKAAHAIGFEVRAMHMHGPGGAGGACEPRVRDVLAVKSVLLPRHYVNPQVTVEGAP